MVPASSKASISDLMSDEYAVPDAGRELKSTT
jgi:hypothetical protein